MKKKIINNNEEENKNIYDFERGISSNIISNERHSEYSDHIYVPESLNKEQLFDRNNILVKLVLLILGLVSVAGTIYYVMSYFS